MTTGVERPAAARGEARALRQRRDAAMQYLQQTEDRTRELRRTLADEHEDVEALESFSLARIWPGLRGSHATDLERETAELAEIAERRGALTDEDRECVEADR